MFLLIVSPKNCFAQTRCALHCCTSSLDYRTLSGHARCSSSSSSSLWRLEGGRRGKCRCKIAEHSKCLQCKHTGGSRAVGMRARVATQFNARISTPSSCSARAQRTAQHYTSGLEQRVQQQDRARSRLSSPVASGLEPAPACGHGERRGRGRRRGVHQGRLRRPPRQPRPPLQARWLDRLHLHFSSSERFRVS